MTGKIEEYIKIIEKAIELDPYDAYNYNNMGAALNDLGKPYEAQNYLLKAIEIKPDFAEAYNNLGNALKDLGRPSEAQSSYLKAIDLKPDFAEAYYNLGNALRDLGKPYETQDYLLKAIELKPDFAEAYNNLGAVLNYLNKPAEAQSCFLSAIGLKPAYAEAYYNLGNALKNLGRTLESKDNYLKAIEIKPDYAEAYYNLGNALSELGKLLESQKSYINAIELKPDFAEAYNGLGNALKDLGRPSEAQSSYLKAIDLKPDFAEAYYNLGNVFSDIGKFLESQKSYINAIELKPDFAEAYNGLGNALKDLGRPSEAQSYYLKAIDLKPDFAEAYYNLGNLLKDLGMPSEAQKLHLKAIELKPDFAEAHNGLGNALNESGRPSEAQSSYLKAIELKPDYLEAYDNLLMNMNYDPAFRTSLYKKYSYKFGYIVSNNISNKYKIHTVPKAGTGNKLKAGFVSGDFKNHPAGYFLESMLSHIKRIELFAYTGHHKEDKLTQRIKPYFSKWREIYRKSDNEAADIIYKDNINVLIDLSGHTRHNRLKIFAYKPAPIQASWFGYPASTGVKEIDYFIGDPYVMPEGEENDNYFRENLFRLPDIHFSFNCFNPPNKAPEVGTLPFLRNGFITFGCFNNLAKINDEVISLWSDILKNIPSAKLFLKTKQLNDKTLSEIFIKKFNDCGVNKDRLILEGFSPRYELLDSYNKIDLALDPFPYNGGITSAEAVYMGVPVLTLKGGRYVSRVGESIAHNVGMTEFIAENKQDYVKKAKEFASDINALLDIRTNLRGRALKSPLFDGERFANNFEDAIEWMWKKYLDNNSMTV